MNYLFVANWKMNMHFSKAINFVKDNIAALRSIGEGNENKLILCPSLIALSSMITPLSKINVSIGAQNCSQHKQGAFTGEVSAQSLAELGCQYCIIGHSERRTYFGETNEMVAEKVARLYEHNIQPIICIGETKKEFENKQVYEVLTSQLAPILKVLKTIYNLRQASVFADEQGEREKLQIQDKEYEQLIIAYEPVWSIGTGIIPEYTYLEQVFIWLGEHIKKHLTDTKLQLLYGGSVNEDNIADLKQILYINGFLIGGASTDFQKLKKIVLL